MYRWLLILALLIAVSKQVVVFESYPYSNCGVPTFPASQYDMPLIDRPYGTGPFAFEKSDYIAGYFTSITTTNITFCYVSNICTTYNVYPLSDKSECTLVRIFGYGRFHLLDTPVVMELFQSSNLTGKNERSLCADYNKTAWYAYARTPLSTSSDPCSLDTTQKPQIFYDSSNSDRLSYYWPGKLSYNYPQPCVTTASSYIPGSKCATTGSLYCVNNGLCPRGLEGTYLKLAPFTGYITYAIKVVTENRAGDTLFIDNGQNTTQTSSASQISYTFFILTFLIYIF